MKRSSVFLLAATLLGLACLSPVHADRDQDRARSALQAGQVLPLKTVLERLEREYPGQVLEVELESEGGRWIYEVKLLRTGGRLVKIKLDARSGELLSHRERR